MTPPDFDPDTLEKDALLQQLGVKTPTDDVLPDVPTSTTMPVTGGNLAAQMGSSLKAALGQVGPSRQKSFAGFNPDPNVIKNKVAPVIGQPQQDTSNTMPVQGASATPARAPTQARVYQGFTPKHPMEGFAFDREQNTGKSAKDAFADLANQAPPPPLNDKAALAQWFTQYIQPGMNELGHRVTYVDGDKFGFENWQGKFDVDYGRGAGAEGGALAWQVDDGTAQPGTGGYTPLTPGPPVDVNGPSAQDEIMAEITALINGGNSQMDERALMELLQGAQV